MTAKLLLAVFALALAAPAWAVDDSGQIGCQKEAAQLKSYLDANRSRLTADQVRDAEQRLDVASEQCLGQAGLAMSNLSGLRNDLRTDVQQAQVPGEETRER